MLQEGLPFTKLLRLPGLLSGKCSLHEAMNEFFGSSRATCKAKVSHICCNVVVETSTDIIRQSPFLVIRRDYVQYLNLKDIPREASVPSKLTDDGTLQYKLMMININSGRDHFLGFFRVAEKYWYSYDGMASEPARRLLLLPSSVSSVFSVVIYVCFSLLRVTNGSELTSEDHKLEPKIDKTSSKR